MYPILVEPKIDKILDITRFTDNRCIRIDGTNKITKCLYAYYWNKDTKKYEKKKIKACALIACGTSGLQLHIFF